MVAALLAVLFFSAFGTESAGPPEQDLPELTVMLGEEEYTAARGSYCWSGNGAAACADASGNPFDYESFSGVLSAQTGADAELVFSQKPQSVRISVLDEGNPDSRNSPEKVRIPDEPGRYGYTVFAEWPEGDISYFFIVKTE